MEKVDKSHAGCRSALDSVVYLLAKEKLAVESVIKCKVFERERVLL
jgi:hypothetical protein